MLSVVVGHRVGAGDEAEDERGGEREDGEEKHLKCRHAEAARFNESIDDRVFHAGVDDQHPKIADCDREIPESHDRALHRQRRLAVGELESGRRDAALRPA